MIRWTENLKIIRTNTGSYVHGEWQDGSSDTLSIEASVQPQSTARLQSEGGGRRIVEAIKVYTKSEVFVENSQYQSDKIEYKGRIFEVYEVLSYDQRLNNKHFKVIAVRMNREDQKEQNGRF